MDKKAENKQITNITHKNLSGTHIQKLLATMVKCSTQSCLVLVCVTGQNFLQTNSACKVVLNRQTAT